MTALSVNLNKVALIRNSRPIGIPDVVACGRLALEAGAHGLTLHPRPDERHVRPADVDAVAELVSRWPGAELNLEGNPLHQLLEHVERVRPQQCTFVPDTVEQATSDHGWDLGVDGDMLAPLVARARRSGARVSLFMDPVPEAMVLASRIGVERVELYTEPYARSYRSGSHGPILGVYRAAAEAALASGLEVNAGHDLNLENLGPFLAAVPGLSEVSIGHALISDALAFGLSGAVNRYLAVIRTATGSSPR